VLAATLGAAPLRVVTLHSVLTEIVTEVGGTEVTVTCLLRPGDDPHTFNPPPAEVRTLAQADLIVASGFGLEPFLDKLVANSGTNAPLVSVSSVVKDVVSSSGAHSREPAQGEADPHWWHSLVNVRLATAYVRDRLSALRPAATTLFQTRAAAYCARLDELAAWAQAEVAQLPPSRRQLVTSHDAFGYLARDYGFTVHPLQGISPEAEPSARDLGALIDLIKREHIRAVFADNTENPKLLAAMLRESGAQLGGTLYADGLGPVGSPAATYAGMFRYNLRTIVEALR
jgi:zinc/manganese transport system substrate-binding protein